jgi:hypothetical protein
MEVVVGVLGSCRVTRAPQFGGARAGKWPAINVFDGEGNQDRLHVEGIGESEQPEMRQEKLRVLNFYF